MADAFTPKFADLVRNYTTSSGTDDFVLGPAVNGFASFADACAVGDRFYYSALGVDNPADSEVGRGTLLAGGVIGREPFGGTKTNFKTGTTAVALVAAAEWFSQLDWARVGPGATNVKSFGATGDGTTDDTAAIGSALDHMGSIGGGTLYFPEGIYSVSSCLEIPARTTIRGAGKAATKIVSAHAGGGGATAGESLRNGSGLTTVSPINASTALYVMIENLSVENSNAANAGAAYFDTGGTYVACRNVAFTGFQYGVVLEQSELVDLDLCEFSGQSAAGVWIVNGGDLTPGALAGFCNRIAIKHSQFNQALTAYGIVDDGGNAHVFEDNNYNGCLNHIRAAGVFPLDIRGGEFESAAGHCVVLDSMTLSGNSAGGNYVAIRGGLFAATAGNAAIHGQNSAGLLQLDGLPLLSGGSGTHAITGSNSFAGFWLLSYSNQTLQSRVSDGEATYVNVDCNVGGAFSINGVSCLDGIVTASNIGSAAARAEADFLQAGNNLGDLQNALEAARNLGAGHVLAQSGTPNSHTGDIDEIALATVSVPANAMGTNGRIEVKTRYSFSGSAGIKTVKVKLGGAVIASNGATATRTGYRQLVEIQNRGSASLQFGAVENVDNTASQGYSTTLGAVDTTVAQNITITGQLGNASDTVTLESFQVILYPDEAA